MDILWILLTTPVLVGLLVLLCLVNVYYRAFYEPMQFFRRAGLPGPKPHFLLGNIPLINEFKGRYTDYHKYLGENFGHVSGFYMFSYPEVVVADPEMIKQMSIKEFDKFPDRQIVQSIRGIEVKGKTYKGLLISMGQEWRKRRQILSPAFTASKMKLMEPLMRKSTLKMVEKLQQIADTEQSIDVQECYREMTLEIILATVFGQSLDVQDGKGGSVYESSKRIFREFEAGGSGHWLSQYLFVLGRISFVAPILRYLSRWAPAEKTQTILAASVLELLESRRNKNETRVDLLQLLINANISSGNVLEDGDIVATSLGLLLAGFETTSNAVTFTSYLLALNTDVQERLANDIHSYLQDHPDESLYDAIPNLEYLDMVVQESLRLYPPGAFARRYCIEDCEVCGVPFKRGCSVSISVYCVQRRADLWPEPEKFDPDRFTAEEKAKRHPYAHVPFGVGPRSCLGMRFAIMEIKMAMIDILENFRIVRSPDTQVPVELKVGISMSARDGIFVRFESRNWEE